MYVMTPLEVSWGYPVGGLGIVPRAPSDGKSAREVLERVALEALVRPPCAVAFSGGRDSSLVLAVATHVARREQLPPPIPVTKVYPDAPDADERVWQERVLRHLGLADWSRVELRDELDIVGPLSRPLLLEHGLIWPPTKHTNIPLWQLVPGGTLLDGEGGDEILGVSAHRVGPLTALARRHRPVTRRSVRRAARAIAPRPLRAAHERRRQFVDDLAPWLRPAALEALREALVTEERRAPLSFEKSVRRTPRRRSQVLADRTLRALAHRYDVTVVSPLTHPDFVAAIGREGGWMGLGDRTVTLRAIAADLLPDAVLARTTKAEFGGAFWGVHARAFAERWDGGGIDGELVDAEELGALWRSPRRKALTFALLQQVWLATGATS